LIDAYSIFRGRQVIKWWDIHNYQPTSAVKHGLFEYVKQQQPEFIDATTDPFPEQEIVSITRNHQLHLLAPILVPDLSLAKRYRDLNFVFYPLWILSAIEKHTSRLQVAGLRRTQTLSCLNRIPRLHRFLTYYLLSQQPWFNQVYVSFAGIDSKLYAHEVTDINQLYALGKEVKDYFAEHLGNFPLTSDDTFDWINNMHELSPAYTHCLANLATETSVHTFCATEKTTKALRAGCLFFPVASEKYIQQLSSMGFDFDFRHIDYSFDCKQDWRSRILGCVNEIAKLYENLDEIWHDNQARLQHNSDWFLSDNSIDYCLQDIKEYV
jgi:hypothetical protein